MAIRFTFKVGENEYTEDNIEKALPSKTMQLLFYKIKENIEKHFANTPAEDKIEKIKIVCDKGEIKKAELQIKE